MTRIVLATCLALALPSLAVAGPRGRHQGGKAGVEKRALHDDIRDSRQAEQLLREWEEAARPVAVPRPASSAVSALGRVEMRVWFALSDEISEANRQVAGAKSSLQRSDQEVQEERRQIGQDYEEGRPHKAFHDARELDDAREDRADDQRDVMREQEYQQRIYAIYKEWARLQNDHKRRGMERKHELLQDLVRLSHYELRKDVNELREDRERRE